MSAGNVEFLTLDYQLCPEGEKPARFSFRCVGFNRGKHPLLAPTKCEGLLLAAGPHTAEHGIKRDPQGQNGGVPQWDWDGNREAPTFSPSINCEKHCGWHGYLRAGRCVNTNGGEEPE